MIGKTLQNLKIVSEIGRGGMGVVYLAEHQTLQKKFAVKSLSHALTDDASFRERFFKEARNQAMLGHVNIVQATDFIEEEGQFHFVMEYVDGQDLGRMIKEQGSIPEEQAVSIITDILEGLQDAHDKGIVHRDIKPSNILVDQSGRARIMDFGIAMLLGGERLTATGTIIGSPWYMSPEQITDPAAIDHRSDIYSAGIVLFEMLTGDVPFEGTSEFVIKNKQVNENPPNPHQCNADIPPKLAVIILKALKKSPDERFQDCASFLASLKSYATTGESSLPGPKKRRKPKKRVWIAGGIAAVIIVCAILFTQSRSNRPREVVPDNQQSALIVMQGAVEKAAIICREFKEIEIRRKKLKAGEDIGDSALIANYGRHIREMEQNVGDGVASYNKLIGQLSAMDPRVVNGALNSYTRSLIGAGKIRKAKLANHLETAYRSFRDGRRSVDSASFRSACSAQQGY
jgi:serine/threonine protein kinase